LIIGFLVNGQAGWHIVLENQEIASLSIIKDKQDDVHPNE
jgi:hypothetical protein